MHPLDIRGLVARYFRDSMWESFGKHIRALEHFLIDDCETGLERIRVLLVDGMPPGTARMFVQHLGYAVRYPGSHREVPARAVHLVVGCPDLGPKDPSYGYSIEQTERPFRDPLVRLAIAHHLAQLALGHCFDSEGNLVIASERNRELEAEARQYAVCLVRLAGEYMKDRLLQQVASPQCNEPALRTAIATLWGEDFANSPPVERALREGCLPDALSL